MLGTLAQLLTVGAHAVGMATHATPAMGGEAHTEGYLTQPAVMADAAWGPFQFTGLVNFEGWTLDRGELNAGVYGEGYVDRRHPHTFLHEAVLTFRTRFFSSELSLSGGRGFAPFGTDDPMVRPFVKYPANHHLSQILERPMAMAAVRTGPLIIEGGLFSGVEPLDPEDAGDFDKLGDSWSGRATVLPRPWLEVQASYAEVVSPENQFGTGLDHHMWNASARLQRSFGNTNFYALVEGGETTETAGDFDYFHYSTVLAEASLERNAWRVAARLERTVRPEEERQLDLFRSVRPHSDNSILGTTRWLSGGLSVSRAVAYRRMQFRPFVEVLRLHAESLSEFPIIRPEDVYGSNNMWSFSFGVRSTIGSWHDRMGRYGVARITPPLHH